MNERNRKSILAEKDKLEESIIKKEEILREIKELVEELKQSEIVSDLQILGDLYKITDDEQKQAEKSIVKKLEKTKELCIHPILCRMGYERHIDSSARLYKADRENALHAKNRCIECGKIVYSKDRDNTDDWDSYIMTPTSMGQYGSDYVKRVIVEPTYDVRFKDLNEYYKEIMIDYPQKEVISMIKQKIKEKNSK